MASGSVEVKGLRELIRAADSADKATKKLVRNRLREVAEPVLASSRSKLSAIDSGSAAKLGISVRRTGIVSVEQRHKRTTGKRPDYGALQMRKALEPALDENTDRVIREFEKVLDDIDDIFERS